MTDTSTSASPDKPSNAAGRKHGGDPHKLPDDARAGLEAKEFPSQQTAAIKARWLVEKNSEIDLKRIFTEIDYQEGLDLLARMRTNCEVAGHTLNARLSHDDESARCVTCGGPRKQGRQWALIRPSMDYTTRIINNHYFCTIMCVAHENQKNQGVSGVSDRGMLASDNPRPAQGTQGPVDQPTIKQPNSEEA